MPDSYQALAVAFAAMLPGALYVLSFERTVGGRWGVNLSDRVTRFVVVSAVLHVVAAPLTAFVARTYLLPGALGLGHLPAGLWAAMVLYVALPIGAGALAGYGVSRHRRWATAVAGRAPQPRAWDFVWSARPEATVRLRLKSGSWVAGVFADAPDGRRAFAGGYPDDGDLYLPRTVAVDPDSGDYRLDAEGLPVVTDAAILVRWEEVEYLVLDR
jgi:hypothetical protein